MHIDTAGGVSRNEEAELSGALQQVWGSLWSGRLDALVVGEIH